MAFAIRKYSDEPVVVVTVDLPLDRFQSNVHLLGTQVDQLARRFDSPPLYTIIDASELDLSFSDILLLIDEFSQGTPGPFANPRVYPIVVGTHPMIGIGVKKVRQRLELQVPWFSTLGEALDHIHARTRHATLQ